MRRVMLSLASGWFLVAAGAPPALAVEGEAWDEGHMRSRYRGLLERPLRPAEVRGEDRYGAIADAPARASSRVPETLPSVSPRSWQSGPVGAAVVRRPNGFQRSFVGGGRRSGAPGSSLRGSNSRGGLRRQGGR